MNSERFSPLLNVFTINPLLSHVPCHLDCEESKRYAREMLNLLEKEDERYAELRKDFLSNMNSLFWYYTDFILLEGEKEGKTITYHDHCPVSYSNVFYGNQQEFRERFDKAKSLIKQGNKLIMGYDQFEVYRDGKKIGSFDKNYRFENILY